MRRALWSWLDARHTARPECVRPPMLGSGPRLDRRVNDVESGPWFLQSASHDRVSRARPLRRRHGDVAGDFAERVSLAIERATAGEFRLRLHLERGRRLCYRFLLDGETWMNDPDAAKFVTMPNGASRSILLPFSFERSPPWPRSPSRRTRRSCSPSGSRSATPCNAWCVDPRRPRPGRARWVRRARWPGRPKRPAHDLPVAANGVAES